MVALATIAGGGLGPLALTGLLLAVVLVETVVETARLGAAEDPVTDAREAPAT